MTRNTEYLLIILVLAMLALSAFNTCNQVTDREHTESEFRSMRDSIAMLDDSLKFIRNRQDSIKGDIAKLQKIKSTIKPHFDKEREKARAVPDDSIGASIRAKLKRFNATVQ